MEYFIILLLIPITQPKTLSKSRIPLLNNFRAPLVAELDVTSIKEELKEYIDMNIEVEVIQTCHAKIQTAVNDSLIVLQSGMLNNFEGEFNGLQQKLTMKFKSLEDNSKNDNTELKQNLTTEMNQLQQKTMVRFTNLEENLIKENNDHKNNWTTEMNQLQQRQTRHFTSLEDSLRKENADLKQNLTKEISKCNLELRKETEQLKELKHNLTTEITQWNLELRQENKQLKSDLEELQNILRPKLVDCSDLFAIANVIAIANKSGVYFINPGASVRFRTYCDMDTDGGGWTVFQRRFNGQTEFYRGWNEYKDGFGDPQGEFWMGNSKLAMMTTQRQYELRIDLENYSGEKAFAKYSSFSIGDESTKYKLTVAGYSGTAGDSLNYHNNQAFSTKDSDNDGSGGNCVGEYKGAWWYNYCYNSNLNGLYGNTESLTGMAWYHWKNNHQSMKTTSMMIRRKRT